eukprot:TRINITY_DN3286_c0_g2_i2.p1 TRINITY_DN3286_c0_g2~~TRINITY_DN3286_c0_g2_i2.p1  ORF type:complete len:491 (-),score=149.16 TRINITY_DN3286_c0_g2_i2:80-1552(-)
MLTKDPWRQLLPHSTREILPKLILKELKPAPEQEHRPEGALSAATRLFDEADTDHDGHLDREELIRVAQQWVGELTEAAEEEQDEELEYDHDGWPIPLLTDDEIYEAVDKQFGTESDGYLDLEQFVVMVGQAPWRTIVPRKHRDELLMAAAQVKADADEYSRVRSMAPPADERRARQKKQPKESVGDAALRMARHIFEEADEDDSGFIDQAELSLLVGKLYAKLNIRVSASKAAEFDQAVQSAMNLNPDGVFLPEFVKMLTRPPWRDVLPEELKNGIPKALMKLMKSEEGDELRSVMSGSRAGSSKGTPRTLKLNPLVRTQQIRFRPSERKAVVSARVVPPCFPPSELPDVVHQIRRVFMEADGNEDGALELSDMSMLANQVWDISGRAPSDPNRELKQIMNQYADEHGMVSLDRFTSLVSNTVWRELLPDPVQQHLKTVGAQRRVPQVPTVRRANVSPQRAREHAECYGPGMQLDGSNRAAAFLSLIHI